MTEPEHDRGRDPRANAALVLAIGALVLVLGLTVYLTSRYKARADQDEQQRRAVCLFIDRVRPGQDPGIDNARLAFRCGPYQPTATPTPRATTRQHSSSGTTAGSPRPTGPAGAGAAAAGQPSRQPSSRTPRGTSNPDGSRPAHSPAPAPSPTSGLLGGLHGTTCGLLPITCPIL